MRVSSFGGTPVASKGHNEVESPQGSEEPGETRSEHVDEEIESLLLELDEPAGTAPRDQATRGAHPGPAYRARRRERPNRFELILLLITVVMGFAAGLLIVLLLNS